MVEEAEPVEQAAARQAQASLAYWQQQEHLLIYFLRFWVLVWSLQVFGNPKKVFVRYQEFPNQSIKLLWAKLKLAIITKR